jgi:hypothetical protein
MGRVVEPARRYVGTLVDDMLRCKAEAVAVGAAKTRLRVIGRSGRGMAALLVSRLIL